tara:strand:+ start:143 stop:682 length:540 start_codon:yes stop_codon:yes gene_type:complete
VVALFLLPHRSHALPSAPLAFDDDPDVAWAASPIEGPALFAEVPVCRSDRLEPATASARLPPDTVAEFAAAVEPLVGDLVNEEEVLDSIVEGVPVDVVDIVPCRDRPTVVLLPGPSVGHDEPSPPIDPVVSGPVDTPFAEVVLWLRSSLSHACSGLHEHNMFSAVNPASRSDLDAFGQA